MLLEERSARPSLWEASPCARRSRGEGRGAERWRALGVRNGHRMKSPEARVAPPDEGRCAAMAAAETAHRPRPAAASLDAGPAEVLRILTFSQSGCRL